ncbi:5-formyltetrahydrofolate cyclo-ligase [Bizionia gelidisalsuginis]|uniref:5-formyltetrahydrofolate cyclo-ligase n=1 Tax=Bizionia gelidisalsuginis TaxID=291188 RepID=A0ABY3MB32_9FLAO|nr:5-formyltetrahydrofolate cyclo-ligase [Bizionia gelidisalsuginis]TYC13509.1 5-formyltetrahydrofolate cyclo-ligase [Bizionia gelidisalsuginis]
MVKAELRKKYKELRKNLSEDQKEEFSLAIANNLLSLSIWEKDFYHIFLSIETQKEINTDYILNILAGKDKNIVISRSNFDTITLENVLLTDSITITLNAHNIPEPIGGIPIPANSIDVVFIPLLAFDEKGNRVGYGKGFYDAFLADCTPDTLKIGLSFFDAEPEIKEVYSGDIPLDFCVTPNKTYRF